MGRLVRLKSSLWAALGVCLVLSTAAAAHNPGSDGHPAERSCGAILDDRVWVGATKVNCGRARAIARTQVRNGRRYHYWGCTGRGTRFGHCHGLGPWQGSFVHWAANH